MSLYHPFLTGPSIGSWMNCMLFAFEISQLFRYYRLYWPYEPIVIRLVVTICFLLDAFCTFSICAWVYTSAVYHFAEPTLLTTQTWSVVAFLVSTTFIGTLVQFYLISRYYLLSKERLVSVLLYLISIAAFVGGTGTSISVMLFQCASVKLAATVWLGGSVVADVLIASYLVRFFMHISKQTIHKSTLEVLTRLTHGAIRAGFVTACLSIVGLVLFLGRPTTNDSKFATLLIGRAYTLCLLYNLNERKLRSEDGEPGIPTDDGIGLTYFVAGISATLPQSESNSVNQITPENN